MQIFKNGLPDRERLISYGFQETARGLFLKKTLSDGEFYAEIFLTGNTFAVTLFDASLCERYALFDVADASGALVGALREEVDNILTDIVENCFCRESLKERILLYARERYGSEPDYPWEDETDYAVLRNENGKWYALFMRIPTQKLLPQAKGESDVLNLKLPASLIAERTDKKGVFPPGI